MDFALFATLGDSEAIQYSNEEARNVINVVDSVDKKPAVQQFPGLKPFAAGNGKARGAHTLNGIRYVINANTLYREGDLGFRTAVGNVTGTDRAVFADDGANLYFVADGSIYRFNGGTLSTVAQSAITGVTSIAYINRSFIITGNNALFAVSNAGDGTTYNTLNVAQAEVAPDSLTRVYTFNQLIYFFGAKTTEIHRYTGTGNPPILRQDSALVNVGIAGKHAVTSTDSYMYWMGDDKKFYKCVASSYQQIGSPGVLYKVSKLSTVSDCIASSFVHAGQDFVLFKLPSSGITLLYSETLDYWVELSSGTDRDKVNSWYGSEVIRCYDKNLVTDHFSGATYELDSDTYTDNGDAILHIISSRSFTGKDIGYVGRIIASGMYVEMQVGVGLLSGQGVNPQLMCEFSHEGGQVWQSQAFVDIGQMGDYAKRVQFDQFSDGYKIRARIMWSDPIPVTMWSGSIELMPGGY